MRYHVFILHIPITSCVKGYCRLQEVARLVNNVWFRSDEKYPTGSWPISYVGQENRLPSRGTPLLRAYQQFVNIPLFYLDVLGHLL